MARPKTARSRNFGSSRYPRWHWAMLGGASLAVCLSIVAVVFAARFYQKSKDRAAERADEQVAIANPPAPGDGNAPSSQNVKKKEPKIQSKTKEDEQKIPEKPKTKDPPIEPKKQLPAVAGVPEKVKNDEILFLEKSAEPQSFPVGTSFGILKREIIRQALLLSAREQFGLRTRDGALDEAAPDRLTAAQRFSVASILTPGKSNFVQVEQGELGARKPVVKLEFSNTVEETVRLAASAELFSRIEFANLFQAAGLTPVKAAFRNASALPAGTEERLAQMSMTSQFAAVRAIHAEMRARGESPELLGALVRAYANLGVLTEHLWVADHKVFKARALLYAERLLQYVPGDAWGYWHRAYARALIGLHADALADIATVANRKSAKPQPEWVALIEPFCRFEDEKIIALADKSGLAQLAPLLRFLVVEDPPTVRLCLDCAKAVLDLAPDCTRALSSAASIGYVGNKHRSTLAYLTVLAKEAPERIASLPGLPDSVSAALARKADEPEVWRALADAGASAADDLPWSSLGRLLREDRFVSIWRRVHFMTFEWSVSPAEFIDDAKALYEDHPKKNVILLHALDRARDPVAYNRLANDVSLDDLDFSQFGIWKVVLDTQSKRGEQETDRALRLSDGTYRDAATRERLFIGEAKLSLARHALGVSPHGSSSICSVLELDPTLSAEALAKIEKSDGHQASVMRALGERYLRNGKFREAERWLKAYLKRSPDSGGYKNLANIAKAQGKLDVWKATLDEFLKTAEYDLNAARIQVDIARYLMSKKEWKEAQPYADAAAKTGAAWAMLCANSCCEGLGEWDKAEAWIQAVSERYPENSFDWFYWCMRVGKGDRAAAQKFVEERIREIGARVSRADLSRFAVFYTLTRQKAEALSIWELYYKAARSESLAFLLANALDELDKKEQRNQILGDFTGTSPYAKLARLFRDTLAKGEKEGFDPKLVDEALANSQEQFKGGAYLFAGCFLECRGKTKEACAFYERCAQSAGKGMPPDFALIANVRMREHGYTPKAPDDKPPKR
jgi:tetratricopeptide (TPR) repeat protein